MTKTPQGKQEATHTPIYLLKAAKNLIEAIDKRLTADKQIPIATEMSELADQIFWAEEHELKART